MRLNETLHPLLTPNNVKTLKVFRIESLAQLLAKDPESLAGIIKISYSQALKLTEELFRDFSAFPVNCLEQYHKQLRTEATIRTGSTSLDGLLGGGFRTGTVYEVYGPAGAGKTQLCMSLSVSVVLQFKESGVFYIDTKNDLSPERVLEILQRRSESAVPVSALSGIKVGKTFKLDPLIQTLRELVSSSSSNLKLVVVDNLVSFIMSLLSSDINLAFSYSSKIQQLLHQISKNGVCVVCTNHSRLVDGELQPALGNLWANLSDIRIKAEHEGSGPRRRFTVVGGMPQYPSCSVAINQAGVV